MTATLNDRIAAYREEVTEVAEGVMKRGRAKRVAAELDDLIQEGLISVWQQLERGQTPSMGIVHNRMVDWLRLLARQTGDTLPPEGRPQHIPYDQILPLDDYRASGDA